MLIRLLVIFACFFSIGQANAEDIKLNADQRVEYHQNEQKLVAVGNAVASKGSMSIKADKLVGYYSPKQKNKISRVEADGKVVQQRAQFRNQRAEKRLLFGFRNKKLLPKITS